jgi:nanoRNase/pAp phosphatase (c-di-AMP/oligoRNAs hydrolase)
MAIPREEFEKVKKKIEKSESILVCVNEKSSLDTYSSAIAFVQHLRDKDKKTVVAVNQKPAKRYKDMLDQADIEYQKDLKPLNYVISIDHTGGEIEKVSYDDEGGKFNLYITPSGSGKKFDFENVDFQYGGGKHDVIFIFGARSLNWLGSLYKENKSLFKDGFVVNLNNLKGSQDYGDVRLVNTEISVGEIVFKLINGESTSSSEEIYQHLLTGILDYLQPMQRNDYKISTIEAITSSVKYGADLKKSFQDLYFKRDYNYFKVVQRMFANLKVEEGAGLAWAGLSNFDLSQTEITKENIPLNGRIPFNIAGDFKAAFVLYEIEDNQVWGEFETNVSDIDAKKLLKSLNPSGNSARVVFSVEGKSLLEVESEILELIKEDLNIEQLTYQNSTSSSESVEESENNDLTDSPNNANNITAENNGESDGAFITPPPITPSS